MRIYARLRPSPQPLVTRYEHAIPYRTDSPFVNCLLSSCWSIALAHVPYTERQDSFTRFNKNPSIRFSCAAQEIQAPSFSDARKEPAIKQKHLDAGE